MISKGVIVNDIGERIEALEPVIVSASRATDIPAFYMDWFMHRLKRNYALWINPFNRKKTYVSFAKTRLIVFWSKNPEPLLSYLPELEARGMHVYLHFTLNDYENEGFEPYLPSLQKRIVLFKEISERMGKGKLIWRFDPLLLTDKVSIDTLLAKIENIGNALQGYTEKLVFSFADIDSYVKVKRNMQKHDIAYRSFNKDDMLAFAKGLSNLNKKWKYKLTSCCEAVDLSSFGIEHNKCIDDNLIIRHFSDDTLLMEHIGLKRNIFGLTEIVGSIKDKGQRKYCGCIASKDIGQYNTCLHACVYCYANNSLDKVKKQWEEHQKDPYKESITGLL